MKVVIFCGGLGLRLREYSDTIPKPLVPIGYRPILWHVMKYYAHFGHHDFILCLGYRGDLVKQYFLNYSECLSNDFVLSNGFKEPLLLQSDIRDWRITFVDTGLNANIGQRLMAVRKHLEGEPWFLANFSDGLTDLHLPTMIDYCQIRDKVASILTVAPPLSFHLVTAGEDDLVERVRSIREAGLWVNGGYFVFRNDIFDRIEDGEDLADGTFPRLAAQQQLLSYRHDGFWEPLDTFKDKQRLEELEVSGRAPWKVWQSKALAEAPTKSRHTPAGDHGGIG